MTADAAAPAVTTRTTRGAAVGDRVGEAASLRLTGRRLELDGLRGVAVLAVIAYHFGIPGAPSGFLGVDVFFVLSGFLITSILIGSGRSLGDFYVRRALRLLPAFALMLAVVGWTVPLVQLVVSAGYLENLSQAFDWLPVSRSLGHTWSLAAEWQFYLLWPAVLMFARRRWRLETIGRAVLVLALASAAWRAVSWDGDWFRSFVGPDAHADPILLGCALALGVGIPFPRWGLALIALPLSFDAFAWAGLLAAGLATAAVIRRPPAILAARPLVAVGRISYGLYLWHVPIWLFLVDQRSPIPGVAVALRFLVEQGIPLQIPAVGLTFLAAALSWRYLEAPLLRLGRDRPEAEPEVAVQVAGRAGLDPVHL